MQVIPETRRVHYIWYLGFHALELCKTNDYIK